MDIKQVIKDRERIKLLLLKYAKKRYDGSLLVGEYNRLTKIMIENNRNPSSKNPCFTKEYWENQFNKDREHLNKNPIIKVENGTIIWKNKKITPLKQPTITTSKVEVNQQVVPLQNYYILNVVGLDKYIDSTEVFIKDLGCQRIEHNYTSIKWQYKGTEKEFNIIRRSVTGLIDTLIPHNSIQVYGKKISQKIV